MLNPSVSKHCDPGPGVGGHCIPVDPYYLSWIAKKNNIKTNLIYHAGKILIQTCQDGK